MKAFDSSNINTDEIKIKTPKKNILVGVVGSKNGRRTFTVSHGKKVETIYADELVEMLYRQGS